MKVHLKRNLWLNEVQYRAEPDGVEVPDMINGRRVVLFGANDKQPNDIVLPRDAVLFDKPSPVQGEVIVKSGAVKPVALSTLTKKNADRIDDE